MVDLERIRDLVQMMVDNDLVELSLRDGSEEVNLKRPGHGVPLLPQPASQGMPQNAPAAASPGSTASAPEEPSPQDKPAAAADDGLVAIRSPMVGTFYHASSPEAPPYVEPGSTVGADTVVCIVEAMKVFNEIKAEISGTIERILVQNQDPVEYGQELFLVRPPA